MADPLPPNPGLTAQGPPGGRLRYPEGHWLRHGRTDEALDAYLRQQSQAYSRAKNEMVAELLGDLAGVSLLDYGCGGGHFLSHALRRGAGRVVGVDAEPGALEIARCLLESHGLSAGWELRLGDIFPTFPPGREFQVILLKDVLEHVPDDMDLLRRAADALAPGGRLVVATQNAWSLNFLVEGFLWRWCLGRRDWMGWDPTHLRFYTPASLARRLFRAGLLARRWRSSYLLPHKLAWPQGNGGRRLRLDILAGLDRRLGGAWPFSRLGWCLMVEARPLGPGDLARS